MNRRAVFGAAVVAIACSIAAPATARADDEPGIERATASSLVPQVRLPADALRSTSKADRAKFDDMLQQVARSSQGRMARTEVLVWPAKTAIKPMDRMNDGLKTAGFAVTAADAFDSDAGHVTPFAAVRKNEPGGLLGLWIETADHTTLLAWGRFEKGTAATDVAPNDLAGGTWSYTTIGSVNYADKTTGKLAEPSGMSVRFTFTKDGRYAYFWFMRQRTYNLVTEATSTHEGTVTFNGDGTFTLTPITGHYKGNTGSKSIDRPMTDAERKPMTFFYEWRTENGQRRPFIGPSKASLSLFKPEEK